MTGESFYRPSKALNAMAGRRLPGGCEDCHAYQEVEQVGPGVYHLTVRHDATCPTLRARIARRNRSDS